MTISFGLFTSFFCYAAGNQLCKHIKESDFVNYDPVLLLATAKYNYTVFDFAQAKKESHLKHMRRQLMEESQFSLLYTQPE